MAIDLAKLRAIARGGITPKMARNAVTTPSHVTGYAGGYAKNPRSYAGYAGYAKNLQGMERDEVEGVTGDVMATCTPAAQAMREQCSGNAEAKPAAPVVVSFDPLTIAAMAEKRNCEAARKRQTDRWCGCCGRMATVAVGRFRSSGGNPEGVTSWRCVECFDRGV